MCYLSMCMLIFLKLSKLTVRDQFGGRRQRYWPFYKQPNGRKFKCCSGKRLVQSDDRLIVQLLDDIQKPDLVTSHQFVDSTANSNSSDEQLKGYIIKYSKQNVSIVAAILILGHISN